VIVPKGGRLPFKFDEARNSTTELEERNERTKYRLEEMSKKLERDPSNHKLLEELVQECRLIVNEMKEFLVKPRSLFSTRAPFSMTVIALACLKCLRFKQKALFLDFLSFDFLKMPQPSQSSPPFFQALGVGLAVYGIETVDPT
jgi:hypothetical protein